MDASGTPKNALKFKTDLASLCIGHDVIKANCITNATTYVNSKPFLSFTETDGILTVNNITGLPANKKFKLKVLLYS